MGHRKGVLVHLNRLPEGHGYVPGASPVVDTHECIVDPVVVVLREQYRR